jgi:hypothetical protein
MCFRKFFRDSSAICVNLVLPLWGYGHTPNQLSVQKLSNIDSKSFSQLTARRFQARIAERKVWESNVIACLPQLWVRRFSSFASPPIGFKQAFDLALSDSLQGLQRAGFCLSRSGAFSSRQEKEEEESYRRSERSCLVLRCPNSTFLPSSP